MLYLLNRAEGDYLNSTINVESLSDSRILVTGSTGMVGSFLTESIAFLLVNQNISGWEITAASNRGDFTNLKGALRDPRVKSISNSSSSLSNLNDFDFVFHLASPGSPSKFGSLEEMNEVNSGFIDAFFSGRNCPRKVLFVSSGEVYGTKAPLGVTEKYVGEIDRSLDRSSYPISKLLAESKLQNLGKELGANVSVARLFHTFGPGLTPNDGRSFGDFLEGATKGKAPILRSAGTDIRSILYSLDAVSAFLQILLSDNELSQEKIFNVGSEIPITIWEFANRVSKICNVGSPVISGNEFFEEKNVEQSPNSVILPDVSKLRSIGWEPEFDVDYAIRRTFEWIKQVR